MAYIAITLLLLVAILLGWAITDIIRSGENRILIFLLLAFPIVGPVVYFQIKHNTCPRRNEILNL